MQLVALFMAIAAAVFFHEAGHWLAAKFFRQDLMFAFEWGIYPLTISGKTWIIRVPRLTSVMPDIAMWQKRVIAAAGFSFEFLASLTLLRFDRDVFAVYLIVCFVHLFSYKYYCGEDNDFSYFKSNGGREG